MGYSSQVAARLLMEFIEKMGLYFVEDPVTYSLTDVAVESMTALTLKQAHDSQVAPVRGTTTLD